MNRPCCVLFALGCLNGFGQTNSTCELKHCFVVPRIALRAEPIERDELAGMELAFTNELTQLKPDSSEPEESTTAPFTSSYASRTVASTRIDPELYRRLEAAGCLTASPPPDGNAFTRCMRIFEPE